MNHRTFVVFLILIAGVLLTGCTNQGGPAAPEKKNPESPSAAESTPGQIPKVTPPTVSGVAPVREEPMTPTDSRNIQYPENMALNSTREIYLKENPTTGYVWNATISAGLIIESDEYQADRVTPGIVGSGGMHHWLIRGIQKGNQTFDAIYKRPWEPLEGNETRYTMNIIVE